MPRLLRAALQRTAWAGRGPHPAPRLALSFQTTAANFRGRKTFAIKSYVIYNIYKACSKNKLCNVVGTENISFFHVELNLHVTYTDFF